MAGGTKPSAAALEPLASKRDRPRLRMAAAADMTLLSFAGTMRCPKRNRRRLRAALRAEVKQSASAVPALAGRLRRYWAMRITNETVLVGVGLDVGDMGPSSSVVGVVAFMPQRCCRGAGASPLLIGSTRQRASDFYRRRRAEVNCRCVPPGLSWRDSPTDRFRNRRIPGFVVAGVLRERNRLRLRVAVAGRRGAGCSHGGEADARYEPSAAAMDDAGRYRDRSRRMLIVIVGGRRDGCGLRGRGRRTEAKGY